MGKVVTFVADALGMPSAADFSAIQEAGWWRRGDGSANDAWAGAGGDGSMHRFGTIARVSNQSLTFERLETKEDWRDRVMLVQWAVGLPLLGSGFDSGFDLGFGNANALNNAPAWPGLNDLISFEESASGVVVMYTGTGHTVATGSVPSFGIELQPGLFMFANSANGDLIIKGNASLAQSTVGVVLLIHSHDQTGENSTPASLNDPSPTDTLRVSAGELNTLQDAALVAQFNEWDVAVDPEEESDAMPLGAKGRGVDPSIPQYWTVRKRDGITNQVQAFRRRQRMAGGGARRNLTTTLADAANVVLDTSIDWRDRFITVTGRVHTSEIRPGDASDTDYDQAATAFFATAYTFTGKPLAVLADARHAVLIEQFLNIHADEATGNLVMRNDTGSARFLGMLIDASAQLGTRTERST